MRKEELTSRLTQEAFDFFYWFSRFEFALKENGYLKTRKAGSSAEPGWDEFATRHSEDYHPSAAAAELLAKSPKQQIVTATGALDWRTTDLSRCKTDLEKVLKLLRTVRNNLFHGGKHGDTDWDDPRRMEVLLRLSKQILNEVAQLGGIEPDYTRYY